MPYQIVYSPDAQEDIRSLDRIDQVDVYDSTPLYLRDQPDLKSRRRKRMEPNPFDVPWALRLDHLRVYYDIDETNRVVQVLRVGVKDRNRVFIRGVETDMREVDD